MALNWMDVSSLSFNTLLLLERVQISWFPGWLPEKELAIALRANPAVAWYLRHKCPEVTSWLDRVLDARQDSQAGLDELRMAELAVLRAIEDLVVYAIDPAIYDVQAFLGWDSRELTSLTDLSAKIVVDVGAGTGRLTMIAAERAQVVFAVEPVANLRHYLKEKARASGLSNVYPVDGLITDIPFPDNFAEIVMGGHVFGDQPEAEYREMARVARLGGMILLCPGNNDRDNDCHAFLAAQGFQWSRFEEPRDGWKRKYWKTKGAADEFAS